MVDNSQEYRLKYWATRSSVRAFARTAHFAHSLARGTVNDWIAILSVFFSIFDHSAMGIFNLNQLIVFRLKMFTKAESRKPGEFRLSAWEFSVNLMILILFKMFMKAEPRKSGKFQIST